MDLEQLGSGGPNPCGDSVKKTSTHFLSRIRVDVGSIATVEPIAQLAEHVFVTERSVAQFPGGVISPTHCSRSLKLQTTTNPDNTCMPPLQEISAHFPQQENQSPRVAHS